MEVAVRLPKLLRPRKALVCPNRSFRQTNFCSFENVQENIINTLPSKVGHCELVISPRRGAACWLVWCFGQLFASFRKVSKSFKKLVCGKHSKNRPKKTFNMLWKASETMRKRFETNRQNLYGAHTKWLKGFFWSTFHLSFQRSKISAFSTFSPL